MLFFQGVYYESLSDYRFCYRHNNLFDYHGTKGLEWCSRLYGRCTDITSTIARRQHLIRSRTKRRYCVLVLVSFIAMC